MRREDEKIKVYKEKYISGVYENVSATRAGQKMYNEAIAGTDKRFKRRERSIDITRYSINAKPLKLSKSSKGKVKFAGSSSKKQL